MKHAEKDLTIMHSFKYSVFFLQNLAKPLQNEPVLNKELNVRRTFWEVTLQRYHNISFSLPLQYLSV